MKNIYDARNFSIFESEVLLDKRITVIATQDFNLFDLCAVIKAMQGRKFKTKVRFRFPVNAAPNPYKIINKPKN